MKRNLIRITGDTSNITNITGNVDGIKGDMTNVKGNVTGVIGDIDSCDVNDDDRVKGVNIDDIVILTK